MSKTPDYGKATNAAYNILKDYVGPFPQIDIIGIVKSLPNISVHTYSEIARKFDITYYEFLQIAPSEHGYVLFNNAQKKWTINYNDLKDECTIRFTLAHELGHITLEHTEDDDIARCEADCFARNILCPVPVRNGFNLATVDDYCKCFNISEPMATVTINLNKSDNYYITQYHYNAIEDKATCYITGCSLAELYGV